MIPDLHTYPKDEIAKAFQAYMNWVLAREGTTFVEFDSDLNMAANNDKTTTEIIRAVWRTTKE